MPTLSSAEFWKKVGPTQLSENDKADMEAFFQSETLPSTTSLVADYSVSELLASASRCLRTQPRAAKSTATLICFCENPPPTHQDIVKAKLIYAEAEIMIAKEMKTLEAWKAARDSSKFLVGHCWSEERHEKETAADMLKVCEDNIKLLQA